MVSGRIMLKLAIGILIIAIVVVVVLFFPVKINFD